MLPHTTGVINLFYSFSVKRLFEHYIESFFFHVNVACAFYCICSLFPAFSIFIKSRQVRAHTCEQNERSNTN